MFRKICLIKNKKGLQNANLIIPVQMNSLGYTAKLSPQAQVREAFGL